MGSDDDIIRNGSLKEWLTYYNITIGPLKVRSYWVAGAILVLGLILGALVF